MKWNIIADSSCDMFDQEFLDGEVSFGTIPFIIRVGNRDFVDDASLDTA